MIIDRTKLTHGHVSPLCKHQGGATDSVCSIQPNPPLNLTACKLRLQVPSALRAPAAG